MPRMNILNAVEREAFGADTIDRPQTWMIKLFM